MAKESPARAILQWLMPSNADVMLISMVIWSRKDGVLRVNADKDERNRNKNQRTTKLTLQSYLSNYTQVFTTYPVSSHLLSQQ